MGYFRFYLGSFKCSRRVPFKGSTRPFSGFYKSGFRNEGSIGVYLGFRV